MEKHRTLNDTEFLQQFINCQISPQDFTHEAHLRLAWIHLRQNGLEKALENIQTQILNYVAFVGAKDKYNQALTIAATKLIHQLMLQSEADNFNDFIAAFPRLKTNFRDLLDSIK
jgi:hypothetical protein